MKVCKFCSAENDDSAKNCKSCGANEFKNKCENCGTLFEEGNFCPKCGVKIGEKAKVCPNCGAKYYSTACPDCGYTNVINRTSAADVPIQPKKKRKTWLWVLGWIFIFPLPLTIIMVNNKKLNMWAKIAIIVCAWLLYILIGFIGGFRGDSATTNDTQKSSETTSQETVTDSEISTQNYQSTTEGISTLEETSTSESTPTQESVIENLVDGFNSVSENKLEYNEDFIVSNKDSGHYRTEFRLNAYKNALGKSYKLGDQIVDIVSSQSYMGDIDVRIYADGATLNQCKELVLHTSKLLDPTMKESTISDTIDYIDENKYANGYYYGELGLLLSGSEEKGYDLMIKTD